MKNCFEPGMGLGAVANDQIDEMSADGLSGSGI